MPKDEVVVLRVTGEEKAVLTAKAVSEGRTLGGWARWVLEREAGVEREAGPEVKPVERSPDVRPKAGPKLKPGVEAALKEQARKRRPGERCPNCNKKGCKGDCW